MNLNKILPISIINFIMVSSSVFSVDGGIDSDGQVNKRLKIEASEIKVEPLSDIHERTIEDLRIMQQTIKNLKITKLEIDKREGLSKIEQCPNLISLTLTLIDITELEFKRIFEICPLLEDIILDNISSVKDDWFLHLSLASHLKRVNVYTCDELTGKFLCYLPPMKIEDIVIYSFIEIFEMENYHEILYSFPHLQSLGLWNVSLEEQDILNILSRCRSINKLNICSNKFNYNFFSVVVQSFPNIVDLTIDMPSDSDDFRRFCDVVKKSSALNHILFDGMCNEENQLNIGKVREYLDCVKAVRPDFNYDFINCP